VDNSLAGSNDAGEDRNNTYSVWVGGVQVSASSAAPARIAEPAITNLTKTVLAPAPQDAGDTVNFRITYSNPVSSQLIMLPGAHGSIRR